MTTIDVNHTLFSSVTLLHADPRLTKLEVCVDMPPKITSDGIWASHTTHGAPPLRSAFTVLELQIITIFVITQGFHFFLRRLGFPYFVSQVMTGFLLGPSMRIQALDKYKKMLFPYGSEDILLLISVFGFSIYLFLNGVQMDFSIITRTGKKAWVISLSSLLIPIALGFLVLNKTFLFWNRTVGPIEAESLPVLVISHSSCSFAVVASLLNDLEILNSELGRLALSSALVSDVSSAVVKGIGTAIVSSIQAGMGMAVRNLLALFAILIAVPLIGKPAMNWVVSHTPEDRPVKKIYTYAIMMSALLLGIFATNFNQPFFVGVVLMGFIVPAGPPLGTELVNQFELLSTWFLLPLFVTSCAMKVDLNLLHTPSLLIVDALVIAVVHLLKLILCFGICRYCKIPVNDGVCLALILSCKGVVDICSCTLLYDAMKLSGERLASMIISILIMGTIARIGVKSLYDPSRKYAGYQERNILNLKPNTELRVVACIHKPSHIVPIKHALQLCSPTTTNQLVAHVLHLMELVGRSSPIFVSHRLQQKVGSSHHNFSGEVIVTFDLFEHDYAGAASVNTYTAISPMTLMHEDICHLALDKIASIIILPFHVRWREDGSVESEDYNIRSLNSRVMERAPCSIGILVNRGSSSYHSSSNRLAMIFLGGLDDREALCLAKGSAKGSNNSLAVYRLVAKDSDSTNWDHMLDDEVLREVQGVYGTLENVTYVEIIVEDASHTTAFLNEIANKYDFIIVGRRNGVKSSQTDALLNWTEFTELGVIGDLLASPDLETRASILVVQQQKQLS